MKTQAKRPRSESVDKSKAVRPAQKSPPSSAAVEKGAPAKIPNTPTTTTTTTAAAAPAPRQPCKNALLVVSTYHAVMAGLVYRKEKFFIKFSVKRHVGRVNGTAVTERYIASSGVDERVFLFTNKAEERLTAAARRKMKEAGEPLAIRLADLGSVTPPAEVTALAFADGSQHLLCGCADGQLLIYRCRDWSVVTTLIVHEKAVVGLAVHPGSHGRLAVTVGEDRAIAVLDLIKGKLLTKWKYTPTVSTTEAGADGGAIEATRSVFAPVREAPVSVLFSPEGTKLVVFSRFSFVVYEAAVMRPLCAFRCATPQPPDEIHCCAFFAEDRLLLGTEAGTVKHIALSGTVDAPVQVATGLATVEVVYPEAVAAQAAALLSGPVKIESETRQKNPLRHVNRVKALQVDGATIFSIDSSGIVIAWKAAETEVGAAALRVEYVTSANCQGRVTGMELYPL